MFRKRYRYIVKTYSEGKNGCLHTGRKVENLWAVQTLRSDSSTHSTGIKGPEDFGEPKKKLVPMQELKIQDRCTHGQGMSVDKGKISFYFPTDFITSGPQPEDATHSVGRYLLPQLTFPDLCFSVDPRSNQVDKEYQQPQMWVQSRMFLKNQFCQFSSRKKMANHIFTINFLKCCLEMKHSMEKSIYSINFGSFEKKKKVSQSWNLNEQNN